MRNPILCLTRNNLNLTRKAIKTFRAQDIGGIDIVILDNGSTDGTVQWLNSQRDIQTMFFNPQLGVAAGWNRGLQYIFRHADHCLVVNNDVELRPDTYRRLAYQKAAFVTAVATRDTAKLQTVDNIEANAYLEGTDCATTRPHPDFSCFLIRRDLYEKVGPFDEGFKGAFCEDGDYDMRMYKAGIRAYCIDLPYLHHGSMTIKNAELREQRAISKQAEANREYFRKKWGFPMASEAYYRALDKGGPQGVL